MRKLLLYFSLLIFHCSLIAQQHVIDSLCNVLKTEIDDTNKVNTLNQLSSRLWNESNYDSAGSYASAAQTLSEKLGFKKGLAIAFRNFGMISYGYGSYPKALEYSLKALEIDKDINDKKDIAIILENIGDIYQVQGNNSKALEYDNQALALAKEIDDKKDIAINLGNIGLVYENQGNYPEAMNDFLKALDINTQIGNKYEIVVNLANIALVYENQNNLSEALDYNFKALAMAEEIKEERSVAIDYCNIGTIYMVQKKYTQAREYLNKGIVLSKQFGEKFITENGYLYLSNIDSLEGNYRAGLDDYKNYVTYHDSLVNEANTKKTVQAEMNYEFEQKQASIKAEQDKKDALTEQERKKQSIIRNSFLAGLLLMMALAFFIFRSYIQKQKANSIITKQKEEVEKQKNIVEKQKKLVEEQKALVEEKNKDILDSINYAKRLQDAILPPLSMVEKYLPESFVLYKPKDIVAGDFYWMERASDTILIAAADCTGHGVPGALVSVVCSNALNRTVKEFKITEPGKILDKVRELVLETFEKSESIVQDGMDISLATLTPSKGGIRMQWAGAFNSLWYIQHGEIKELAADKQPIGKTDKPLPFTTHNIELGKGDSLYLFTDGYADQFGGPKGKKFKYKAMQEKLLAISHQPMAEQKSILDKTIEDWKGNLEQVDDILITGIKI
jgi:serine phosphatase RsbU (regulator of sigma subunit)